MNDNGTASHPPALKNRRFTSLSKIREFAPILGLTVAFLIVFLARKAGLPSRTADGVIVTLATVATLQIVNGFLPLQNIFGLAVVISAFAGCAHLVSFEVHFFRFKQIPEFCSPLLWTVVLLNARGLSQWILKSRRAHRNYGVCLIALSSLVVAILEMGSRASPTRFLTTVLVALLFFAVSVPLLIDKRNGPSRVDLQPSILLALLFVW